MTCDIPCADCARGIINAGIVKIYAKKGAGAKSKKWDESSIRSMQMFKEAGVKLKVIELNEYLPKISFQEIEERELT